MLREPQHSNLASVRRFKTTFSAFESGSGDDRQTHSPEFPAEDKFRLRNDFYEALIKPAVKILCSRWTFRSVLISGTIVLAVKRSLALLTYFTMRQSAQGRKQLSFFISISFRRRAL
jgi:hypothetical protein